jgi:hypothetical protein
LLVNADLFNTFFTILASDKAIFKAAEASILTVFTISILLFKAIFFETIFPLLSM